MTIKELRAKLFDIKNQELSIGDLRRILFDIEDQNKEISLEEILLLMKS